MRIWRSRKILIPLLILAIAGISWIIVQSDSAENEIPTENTPKRMKIFPGYENYLERDKFSSTVHGNSMEPIFGEGDKIIWVKVKPSELEVRDIIVYEHPTKGTPLIAHRIIDIRKDGEYRFETKGDNRDKSDAETGISGYYVREEHLKGLMIGVIYPKNSKDSASADGWSKMKSLGGIISTSSEEWTIAESWET